MTILRFQWDAAKAASNAHKHGVTFEEAASAFADILSLTIPDPAHSDEEERFVLIGLSLQGRHVVVVHTYRSGTTRLISARLANRREREVWSHGQEKQ